MSRLKNAFNAIRMLGVFGFILVCAVIIIGLSVFDIFLIDQGIVAIHGKSEERFLLENIEYYLLEEELAERKFLSHEGSPQAAQDFEAAGDQAKILIEELSKVIDDPLEISLLQKDRATVQQDFEEIASTFEEGQAVEAEHLDQVLREEGELNQQLDDLVFDAEVALDEQVALSSRAIQRAILIGLIGLILFPLLAVWAFLIASRITQPLLSLSNAVMAAGGGHYRDELLDEVLDRRDSLGRLARAVDEMAEALHGRERAQQEEIDRLRKQLHETQRHKLVLTTQVRHEASAAPGAEEVSHG